MSLRPHIKIFTKFAKSHLSGVDDDDYLIRLKVNHTMNVMDQASSIVEKENITGRMGTLCRLAALYHDIGRFPQFKTYGTFNDRISTNHARLGVLTLRSLELPTDVSQEEWRIIRFAVAQHNLKTTNTNLPAGLTPPTMVVRDADKLDIYRVIIEHFTSDEPQNSVVTHGLEDIPGKYSIELCDSILSGQMGDYKMLRYASDFKLIAIGWLFSINYAASLQHIAEMEYLEQIFSLLPKDNKIQELKDKTNKFMHYNSRLPS